MEQELIKTLYKINSKSLDQTNGVFFGNGKHASDFRLFEQLHKEGYPIVKNLEKDLIEIMKQAVQSDIYIMDSFFNILKSGGGSNWHTHKTTFDKLHGLSNQKYSLTYHLDIGDQKSSEPGILKFQNPVEEILPSEGMIMIFAADRPHSAVYNGNVDRIMIGVNFYSII